MVQAGIGGLDTPRTNVGDATYLSNANHDFDLSIEQSFQSPSKDNNNLLQQLRNNRRGTRDIRTPRSRVMLGDKRNLQNAGEFTPLLKSATGNNARRSFGKENVPQTPAFLKSGGLDNIPEDLSPVPASSVYGGSRNGSYLEQTTIPHIDSSSSASTPMALLPRRNEGPAVLQDGNQLSLREQENVIDRIEKENFGLKLKIHFLEEALRKAGPGFSEAALKENTDLKVDKITMQRELSSFKKILKTAEREVEAYRQQVLDMQERAKAQPAAAQGEELDRLRRALEETEVEMNKIKLQEGQLEDVQDQVHDLEAELREKNRLIDDRDDEVENLKDEIEKQAGMVCELEEDLLKLRRRAIELEEEAQKGEELDDAKQTIEELERDLKRSKQELEDAAEERQDALKEKERAVGDLEDLQEELANKSMTTKGFSRQLQEKATRLQDNLKELREKYATLEEDHANETRNLKIAQDLIEDLKQDNEVREQKLQDKLDITQTQNRQLSQDREILSRRLDTTQQELQQTNDEKNLLQIRHDTLTQEFSGLQKDLARSKKTIGDLEDKLSHEKTLALGNEREVRDEYKKEIDRLNDDIEGLQAQIREKERFHENDRDKWENERRTFESERDMADEKAAGLQRTIDRLQESEGTLSSSELRLQEAFQSEKDRHKSQEMVLQRQIEKLNEDIAARRNALEQLRSEFSDVQEELRLSQREQKALSEKVEGLEDEVEILQTSFDDEIEQANHEIAAAKQESESLRVQVHKLELTLEQASSATTAAKAELDAFHSDTQTAHGANSQLAATLEEVEANLAKIRLDKQGLQDQINSMKIEMHSLRLAKAKADAERDIVQSQMKSSNVQDDTFCSDQEKIDLRTCKMKLDTEVRRLREENKTAIALQQTAEKELHDEIDRASAEEARLTSENHDLQRILRGSSEKRELANAKKTIQKLEERVAELEAQIPLEEDHGNVTHELSMIRRDLTTARQKESEYLQRDAAQKETLRALKLQISELERKAHESDISRREISPLRASVSSSTRKSEVIEVRAQLVATHQSLKEVRSQLKHAEMEANRKLNAANMEFQAQNGAWESERDHLEQSLDKAKFTIEELKVKKANSEATIARLRSKIDRLEKSLHLERQNSSEDRTMALERHDLHEMLRDTQVQVESLEVVLKEREEQIETVTAAESQLRAQLKRVRDERSVQKFKAASVQQEFQRLERQYRDAQTSWAIEKKNLTRGVRFVNTSMSTDAGDRDSIVALRKTLEEREHQHQKEQRGVAMQIEWYKASLAREQMFRAGAAHAKHYMGLQIELYQACNKVDIKLLEASAGVKIPPKPKKRPVLRMVAQAVRAMIRMQILAREWKKHTEKRELIIAQDAEGIKERKGARLRAEARERLGLGTARSIAI